MNDHFEELIHDGIDQLTAGSSLPPGLADRARRQVRRRRHQVRAAVAAGTAAVAAIAVIAATSAGSAGTTPAPHPVPTVALLAKIERAIASKARSAPVLQIKTTYPAALEPTPPDPFSLVAAAQGGFSTTIWTRRNALKFDWFDGKGHILSADLTTVRGLRGTDTHVEYDSPSWYRMPINFFVYKWALPKCDVLPHGPGEPQSWAPRHLAKEIKNALACGQVKFAGHQRIDGVDAIKLSFATGHVRVEWTEWKPKVRAVTRSAMWVDAHSYLPLRYRSTLTEVGARHRSTSVQTDFLWLRATKSALAKLRLVIPRGFPHKQPKTIKLPAPHK